MSKPNAFENESSFQTDPPIMLLFRPCALHLALAAVSLLVGFEPAPLDVKPLPPSCVHDVAKRLCDQVFDDHYVDECIDVAEAADFVVKGPSICYRKHLNRCIPVDICPEAYKATQVYELQCLL